jgi:signal transduction histidine kinase
MGFKIRSQIAGLLFLLFSFSLVMVGYFNITILSDTLYSLAASQSELLAGNITMWVGNIVPPQGFTREYIILKSAQMGDLKKYLNSIGPLHSALILDAEGEVLFRWQRDARRFAVYRKFLEDAMRERQVKATLWSYRSRTDESGVPLESMPVYGKHLISYEYFKPFTMDGRVMGVLVLSLDVEKLPQKLNLIFLGNCILGVIFFLTAFIAILFWSQNAIYRPLAYILRALEQLGRGDFSAHVDLTMPSTNELVRISSTFNDMVGDIRKFQEQLQEKSKTLEAINEQYKRLNERLEQEVEANTKEQREFFNLTAHDLKVPLAAIQGYADLLLRSPELSEKQRTYVTNISSACEHLLSLTKNLSDMVKYEAGKISYFMEDFTLDELLQEVHAHVNHLLEEKGLSFHTDVPDYCRRVRGDRMKIGQVLTNLVNNAITFTPRDGAIFAGARERAGLVEIFVEDTGAGIEKENLSKVFDRFSQFSTEFGRSSGLGLGLYIVKKIVEGHGQSITVKSTVGKGTRFAFTLPRAPLGEEESETQAEAAVHTEEAVHMETSARSEGPGRDGSKA